jgi:hypothetical protein
MCTSFIIGAVGVEVGGMGGEVDLEEGEGRLRILIYMDQDHGEDSDRMVTTEKMEKGGKVDRGADTGIMLQWNVGTNAIGSHSITCTSGTRQVDIVLMLEVIVGKTAFGAETVNI